MHMCVCVCAFSLQGPILNMSKHLCTELTSTPYCVKKKKNTDSFESMCVYCKQGCMYMPTPAGAAKEEQTCGRSLTAEWW